MRDRGYACEMIAPSLIRQCAGVQREHDKRTARELARLYRAGELTTVRIPSEAEERVRDVVRCRGTFQREILKSRHYILKFLARRDFVYRDGTNWCTMRGAALRLRAGSRPIPRRRAPPGSHTRRPPVRHESHINNCPFYRAALDSVASAVSTSSAAGTARGARSQAPLPRWRSLWTRSAVG